MKKRLLPIAVLTLLLGVVSCNKVEISASTSSPTSTPTSTNTSSSTNTSTSTSSSSTEETKVEFTIDSPSEVEAGKSISLIVLLNGSPYTGDASFSIAEGSEFASLDGSTLKGIKEGSVVVKASVTYNNKSYEASKTINVLPSSVVYTKIADIKKLENGASVTLKAKVIATSGTSAYLGDETGSIFVYNWYYDSNDTAINNKSWTLGDVVEVKTVVTKDSQRGLQLNNRASKGKVEGTYAIKLEGENIDVIAPITIDEAQYKALTIDNVGTVYSFTATYVSGAPVTTNSTNVTFKMGETEFILRTDGNSTKMYDTEIESLVEHFNSLNLVAGDTVNITTPLSWYSNPQFAYFSRGTTISKVSTGRVTIEDVASTSLVKGETLQLSATVDSTEEVGVTWSTSNDAIATVSEAGLVTGVKEGNVTITATSKADETQKASIDLTILASDVVPTKVEISSPDQVEIGSSITLEATFTPTNATKTDVTYSIEAGEEFASLEGNTLTGVKEGKVTVKVVVNDTEISSTKEITVISNVKKLADIVKLTSGTVTARGIYMGSSLLNTTYNNYDAIFVGDGETSAMLFRAKSLPENLVEGESVIEFTGTVSVYGGLFEVASPEIKVVEDDSIVKPVVGKLNKDNAYTFTENNISQKVNIADATVKSITGDTNKTITLAVNGVEYTLYAKANTVDFTVIDSLAVNDIVSLDAYTSVFNGNYQFTFPKNVTKTGTNNTQATGITISASENTIGVGGSTTLSAKLTPSDATTPVSYELASDSDTDVVKIDGNKVTGLKAGTAKIVGKAGEVTSEAISITVEESNVVTVKFDTDFNTGFTTISEDEATKTVGNITFSIKKADSSTPIAIDGEALKYTNPIRIYKGMTFEITSSEGTIASFTTVSPAKQAFSTTNVSSKNGTVGDNSFTANGDLTTITLNALNQFRLSSIAITLK